jgi:hypothetical protein
VAKPVTPPKPVAVAPPVPVKPVAVAKPPTPVAPAVPSAAQVKAQQQAALAKSLGFLSPSLNKPQALATNEKTTDKYKTVGSAAGDPSRSNTSVLNAMANGAAASDGPVDVKNARNIASGVAFGGSRKGKGLNQVQGKVSLNALYDPGSADASALGASSGLTMSGPGTIPEGLIEKILAKHLAKFQYCYEKALLTDASLAGTVTMQWTINLGGSSSDVKVVRSKMSNAGLHNCVTAELRKIRFPSPSGGAVVIKYPFSFSSTSI